ncbi:hypothetical protein RND81_09G033200 [Saponaria officinalis]|uniref:Reverse transcriptase n=1 Tax=Saponaria officinalis TaxID=3572 RepID=A0AAW1II56_SAPOF
MSLLSLNCRELGNPEAVGSLRDLLRREAPALVFLCETKLSSEEMRRIRRKFDNYEGKEVDSAGRSGGLAFLWRKGICCELRDAANDCGLRDLQFEEYEFTYDNGQEGKANRQSRLDRAMATEAWLEVYPYARLHHLDREWSDHAPIKLYLDARIEMDRGKEKFFRFEQIWVGEDGCEEAIKRAWGDEDGELFATLTRCTSELNKWKGINIGKILRELRPKRKRLKRLNECTRTATAIMERRKIVKEIAILLKQEETFWRQRSRALWLKDGDKNTKYFHRKAGQRKQNNHIAKLIDENGNLCEGSAAIERTAVSYYADLFSTTRPEVLANKLKRFLGDIVSENQSAFTPGRLITDNILVAFELFHHMKNNRAKEGHMALKLDMSKAYDRVE